MRWHPDMQGFLEVWENIFILVCLLFQNMESIPESEKKN